MSWLNPGRWMLYAALIGAVLLGVWRLDVSRQQIGYDKAVAEQAVRDKAAEAAERAKETKWQQDIDGVAYDAQEKIDAMETELASANAAADRLRAAAKVAASRARQNPGTADASAGKPGADPLDLLVDVLDRHNRELVEIGGYADKLRVAGLACEKSYDALR